MKSKFMSALLLALGITFAHAQTNLTVHEWGTFTSLQGGNGQLISWRPLKTSELPGFVYSWTNPGFGRFSPVMAGGKGEMITLQRMETPVIYFYSSTTLNADVSVKFPKGTITEWYPQATQIGPSLSIASNSIPDAATPDSLIVWKGLVVSPDHRIQQPPKLISDNTGNHYYAARKTDSDIVQTALLSPGSPSGSEKFLFYRGAGSFETPLKVTVDTNNRVTVENKGPEKLSHLFLVSIHKSIGAYAEMDGLTPGNSVPWRNLDSAAIDDWKRFPLPEFQYEIVTRMQSALTDQGLSAPEAEAMVKTWLDSWFTEEGERVLYILPRTWTDETLPLTITPKPDNLVRVMVGRAEIITPKTQQALTDNLTRASKGDATARSEAIEQLRKLGRFAEPAINLAAVHGNPEDFGYYGFGLLPEVLKPSQK